MNARGEPLDLLFSDVAVAIVVFLGYVYTEPFRTGPVRIVFCLQGTVCRDADRFQRSRVTAWINVAESAVSTSCSCSTHAVGFQSFSKCHRRGETRAKKEKIFFPGRMMRVDKADKASNAKESH